MVATSGRGGKQIALTQVEFYSPPMTVRFPPLAALRVFAIAARHDRFLSAAQEAGLTPSAVSHQVRLLEEHLGVALFERTSKGVSLTPAGVLLASAVDEAAGRLAEGIADLQALASPNRLRISCVPAFAAILLAPSIDEFESSFPGLDVRLEVTSTLADFVTDGVDCAIRYGRGQWLGLQSWSLGSNDALVVGSPDLVLKAQGKAQANARPVYPIVAVDQRPEAWQDWFEIAQPAPFEIGSRVKAESLVAGFQLAQSGAGLLLAPAVLAAPLLAAGRLVAPFPDRRLASSDGYHLVCRRAFADDKRVQRFKTWLFSRLAAPRPSPPGPAAPGSAPPGSAPLRPGRGFAIRRA